MKERQILEESIENHKQAIATAESKLAELDKPELKDGDYGMETVNSYGEHFWLYLRGVTHWLTGRFCDISDRQPDNFVPYCLGNLVDDLKRNSEDLEKFKFCDTRGDCGVLEIIDKDIWVGTDRLQNLYSIRQATEIHQKLGQILATAKRKEVKK